MYLLVSNDVTYFHYSTKQPPTAQVGDIIIFRHYSIHLFIFAKNTLDLLQRPCILLADMHDYRTSGVSLHMCHMMSARIQGRSACKELQCEECELRHTFYFMAWLFHHVGANISSTKIHSGPVSLLLYHIILGREKNTKSMGKSRKLFIYTWQATLSPKMLERLTKNGNMKKKN